MVTFSHFNLFQTIIVSVLVDMHYLFNLCLMFELNNGSVVVVVDVARPYSEIQRWRN